MNEITARTIFSVCCLLGVVAIGVGAFLEILRQQRGESLLRPGQFRLRIFSSLIWIVLLGSFVYAVAFLWPQGRDQETARKFLALISGSLSLLLIALMLLAYDVWQVGRQRRLREKEFQNQLEGMAHAEIQKISQQKPIAAAGNESGDA